jgi:hypothetical protein
VAFGSFFLMRIPTAAWKSLEGFSTFTTGPTTIINKERTLSLKTIRGGCAIKKKAAFFTGADGVVDQAPN